MYTSTLKDVLKCSSKSISVFQYCKKGHMNMLVKIKPPLALVGDTPYYLNEVVDWLSLSIRSCRMSQHSFW